MPATIPDVEALTPAARATARLIYELQIQGRPQAFPTRQRVLWGMAEAEPDLKPWAYEEVFKAGPMRRQFIRDAELQKRYREVWQRLQQAGIDENDPELNKRERFGRVPFCLLEAAIWPLGIAGKGNPLPEPSLPDEESLRAALAELCAAGLVRAETLFQPEHGGEYVRGDGRIVHFEVSEYVATVELREPGEPAGQLLMNAGPCFEENEPWAPGYQLTAPPLVLAAIRQLAGGNGAASGEPVPGKRKAPEGNGKPEVMPWHHAMAILLSEPEITPTELARQVGVSRGTLYGSSPNWASVRATLVARPDYKHRGSKNEGELEAWDSDDE